jgi:dipeptidyl aminopeptidase/acylaminoacyl peptidase
MKAVSTFLLMALAGACGESSTTPEFPDAGPPVYTYFYVRATASGPDVVLGDVAGDIRDVWQLEGVAAYTSAMLSPDQSQIAVETYDDTAKAYVLSTRPLSGSAADEHVLDHAAGHGTERWSPDGKHLAYAGSDGGVYVVDATGGTPAKIASWSRPSGIGQTTSSCAPVAWSPDSKSVVTSTGTGLAVYDVGTAQTTALVPDGTAGWICSPAWSPDGHSIAFAHGMPSNINSLEEIPATGGKAGQVGLLVSSSGPLQWSPDSQSIAYVDLDTGVQPGDPGQGPVLRVVGAGGGAPSILTGLTMLEADRPQWSSDSRTLLYVALDGAGDAQLTTISATGIGPNPLPLIGAAVGSTFPAWLSPPIVQ